MRQIKLLVGTAVFIALYVVLALTGQWFAHSAQDTTPLWPAAGIGFALLWLYGYRAIPVIVLGELATSMVLGRGWAEGLIEGVIGLIEAGIGVGLLAYLKVSPRLRSLRDTVLFIVLGATLPCVFSGLVGALDLLVSGTITAPVYWRHAFNWGLGDALGILIVAPLVVEWAYGMPLKRLREWCVWLAVVLATALAAVGVMLWSPHPSSLFFTLMPFAVMSALLAGMVGATAAVVVLTGAVFLMHGHGSADLAILTRLVFVGACAATAYILAAVVAEQRCSERRLAYQATHDSLTGLINRAAFNAALRDYTGTSGLHALFYIDLDNFKLLNDSNGHDFGDQFLHHLADHLKQNIPANAMLARLGGDEFALLMWRTQAEAAIDLANRLSQRICHYQYHEKGQTYSVSASVGVSLFQQGDASQKVLSQADLACYMAKSQGRNRVQVHYIDDPQIRANHLGVQRMVELRSSLAKGNFALVRQCIQPLSASEAKAPEFYQILLRQNSAAGLVSPADWLNLAARYGLTPMLDRWVIERCFQYLSAQAVPPRLSVNIYGITLTDPAFYDDVLAMGRHYDVDPACLCFAVSERVAIQHLIRATTMMHRLVEVGYQFALDDFGDGVASFGHLKDMPVQHVKIDGHFVRGLSTGLANAVIVDALVKITALRHITCIAQWVETQCTLKQLQALGVAYGQGYYFGTPAPFYAVNGHG